jgi:hypothetical protein
LIDVFVVQNQTQVVQTGGAGGVQTITVGGGQQVPSVSSKNVLSSYTYFLFSKDGRICLITINIIKNGDI